MKRDDFWISLGIYGGVGIQLALTVVAGWFIGNFFDEKWGTGPWLALSGLVSGFVGGLYNLIRILRWRQK
ncbi:MAG: AtpZ/AtpI family protein [Deltaproteobacteria bacterium]|nr:AtpZ/AtpI family protein [Deltaproteobacteria bacterium]